MDSKNLNLQDMGKLIRIERLARKLKQSDLADKSSLSRQTIIKIEKGMDVHTSCLIKAVSAMGCAIEIKPSRLNYDDFKEILDNS